MTVDVHEQNVIDVVARVGWMVMKVSPNHGDADPRWFAYTIGLSVTHSWPEIICFGWDLDVMGQLVNNAVLELTRRSKSPSPGLELSEVMEGFAVKLQAFPTKFFREHLGWAIWFAQHRGLNQKSFDCMQLIFPDKDGRFASDPSCDAEIRRIQMPISTGQ